MIPFDDGRVGKKWYVIMLMQGDERAMTATQNTSLTSSDSGDTVCLVDHAGRIFCDYEKILLAAACSATPTKGELFL